MSGLHRINKSTFVLSFFPKVANGPSYSYWYDLKHRWLDDEDIKQAIVLLLEHTHNLAEGAGAVALAAALNQKERLRGKKVVLVMSGGNLAINKLREILNS